MKLTQKLLPTGLERIQLTITIPQGLPPTEFAAAPEVFVYPWRLEKVSFGSLDGP